MGFSFPTNATGDAFIVCLLSGLELRADEIVGNVGKSEKLLTIPSMVLHGLKNPATLS
jgi:hypothetical protein